MSSTTPEGMTVEQVLETLGIQQNYSGEWWADDWRYEVTDQVNNLLAIVEYKARKDEIASLGSLLSKYGNKTEIKSAKIARHLSDRLDEQRTIMQERLK